MGLKLDDVRTRLHDFHRFLNVGRITGLFHRHFDATQLAAGRDIQLEGAPPEWEFGFLRGPRERTLRLPLVPPVNLSAMSHR